MFEPSPNSFSFPVGETAIDHYVALTTARLQGWTSQSVAVWRELTGYRLVKAYHYKYTNSPSEHEFITYEFVDEHENKVELRTDRRIGARKHTSSSSRSTSSVIDGGYSPINSLFSPSSRSSLLLPSLSESDSKASSSEPRSSLSLPSDISSNQYLANDTIIRIQGRPDRCEVLRTITFNGDSSLHPSLWDVVILVLVVHNDSAFYTLHARQCYWFADTIFGTLEKWAAIHKNGTVAPDEKEKVKRGRRRASTGSRGVVPVHRRKPEHIDKIWDNFKKERQVMTQQKEEYERVRTEEVETAKRLAGQVKQLLLDSAKDKKDWEEKERQLRKEEAEREQRYQAEKRMLEQELTRLQHELQNRDLQKNAPATGKQVNQRVSSESGSDKT
ncbi:hypothetical protein F5887DRAFT_1181401 [Amanita rubescens]|nr:hypothetical protein F5887DRAFT_1181401 [Amanita rubescens]